MTERLLQTLCRALILAVDNPAAARAGYASVHGRGTLVHSDPPPAGAVETEAFAGGWAIGSDR